MIIKSSIRKKFNKVKVPTTIDLPIVKVGGNSMDSTYMYDFFKNNNQNNEPYIIYSAGIADQINFELDLLRLLNDRGIMCELYAIDPTPKALAFLAAYDLPSNFHVLPYALSNKDGELSFALPKAEGWVSGSAVDVKNDERDLDFDNKIRVEGRTISSIMKELNHTKIDLLKMDIEGSEFDVLENVLNKQIVITEMLIDHHEFMLKQGKKRMKNLLKLVNEKYSIFYADNFGAYSFGCISKNYKIGK